MTPTLKECEEQFARDDEAPWLIDLDPIFSLVGLEPRDSKKPTFVAPSLCIMTGPAG
jgi:hypothetical protein